MRRLLVILAAGCLLGLTASPLLAQPEAGPLWTLHGTLDRTGNRYTVAGTEADFGPAWYLNRTMSNADYDRDGTTETFAAEFDGLVGTQVALRVDAIGPGGDADVYTVNGTAYRDPADEPPPWAGGPRRTGVGMPEHAGPPAGVPPAPVGPVPPLFAGMHD